MEIIDVVDEFGNPTGESVDRDTAHAKGIRHRTAHVWITRIENGSLQVLLQKRASCKESFPGCYDTSSAGHIKSGDIPILSAIRELKEELGISAADTDLKFIGTFNVSYQREFHGKLFIDNEVPFVYIYSGNVDPTKLILQEEEVESADWFNLDYVINERTVGNPIFCVPTASLKLLKSSLQSILPLK